MMRKVLVTIVCFLSLQISAQSFEPNSTDFIAIESDTIPQGKIEFQLHFAEWDGRMRNVPCEVLIDGKNITVQQTSETNLTGGKIITKGVLMKHKSGRWIIGKDPADINAEEIGGCTGGPIPVDFDEKVIEWC